MAAEKWTSTSSRYPPAPSSEAKEACVYIDANRPRSLTPHSPSFPRSFPPKNAFEGLGVKLSLQEVSKMAKEVDDDGSGMLGPEEFLQLLHMHPDLFGHNSNSLQIMASAHRRAENINKLINKPPGKSVHESEFKLPPVTDLPGRRMPRKR
jgi:hypothetical protein